MEWISYAFQGLTALFTGSSAVVGFMMRKRPRWAAFVIGSQPLSMQPPKVFVRIDNVGNGTAHNVRTNSNRKSKYKYNDELKDKKARVEPGESIELEIDGVPIDPKKPLDPIKIHSDTRVEVTWSQPPFWNHRKSRKWLLNDLEVDD